MANLSWRMEGGGTHVHVVVVIVDDYYGNEGGVRRSGSKAKMRAEETSRHSPWPWSVWFLMTGWWQRCVE